MEKEEEEEEEEMEEENNKQEANWFLSGCLVSLIYT